MNLRLRGLSNRLIGLFETQLLYRRLHHINAKVEAYEADHRPQGQPVIFFNASSRIRHLSQNAAFSLLTSWGLRLSGTPVVYYVCHVGMAQCQLGAVGDPPPERPPCRVCVNLSRRMYPTNTTYGYHFTEADIGRLSESVEDMSVGEMTSVMYRDLPLGELCLPSLRWSLRRHNLADNAKTQDIFRKFLLSAANVAHTFDTLLQEADPQAVVLFNGISFPEAVAREVACRREIPVITHEVSAMPLSAFFSHDYATAYRLNIPDNFQLSTAQEAELDQYLSRRFQGDFTMAGIRFWPEMRELPADLLEKIGAFEQVVPVFTNVIFDTSQMHANTIFRDMFGWLETVLDLARKHEDTLFVIRAHPDELRRGKQSLETVESKLLEAGALEWPNVVFIPPQDFLSSYELIRRSKFVMVYNSSIGLEATFLHTPVLAGGQARYTHYPTVYLPESSHAYIQMARDFLQSEQIDIPGEFIHHARRFMYYHLFRASLDFSAFIRPRRDLRGSIVFRSFDVRALHPQQCIEMEVLRRGILKGESFIYPDKHVGDS